MIVVVDDDPGVQATCAYILQARGLNVRSAPDGRAALALLDEKPPRAVLVDIYMPGMEGIETILQIRRRHPAARIVAMSGSRGSGYDALKAASALGADAILHKPFTSGDLHAAIEGTGHGSFGP